MDFELHLPDHATTPPETMDNSSLEAEVADLTKACSEIGSLVSHLYDAKDSLVERKWQLEKRLFEQNRPEDLLAYALSGWESPKPGLWVKRVDGRGIRDGSYRVSRDKNGLVEITAFKLVHNTKSVLTCDSVKEAISWLKDNVPSEFVLTYPSHFYDRESGNYFDARREGRLR